MQANLASAPPARGCLIAGMSNAFSELIERAGSEQPLTRDEIHTLLVDGEGQDFALIEAASILRRNEFRNMIAVHTENEELADALGTRSIAVDSYDVLDISRDIDSEELAETIERIAASPAIGVTVLLPKNAVPMMLMRVLSILRLAAPSKVIHLPEGYDQSLRSLTSLAMHVVSAITITDDIEQWPMVNEILKSLRHGGIVISGTGGRDALAGYLRYLSDLGVDLMGHREARGSACGSVGGGCGCGSGGCGGHEESSSGGCGCGSGGCGSSAEAPAEAHGHSHGGGGCCGGHDEPKEEKGGCCGGHDEPKEEKGGCCGGHDEPKEEKGGCCGGHDEPEPVVEEAPAGGCGCGAGGCGSK